MCDIQWIGTHTHVCEDLILWFWHTRFSEDSDFNFNKDYREVTKPQFHFIYTLMLSHITSCTSTWFQLFSSDKDIPNVAGHGQDSWKRSVDGFSYFRWFSVMLFSNQNHLCYMIYQSPPPSLWYERLQIFVISVSRLEPSRQH